MDGVFLGSCNALDRIDIPLTVVETRFDIRFQAAYDQKSPRVSAKASTRAYNHHE